MSSIPSLIVIKEGGGIDFAAATDRFCAGREVRHLQFPDFRRSRHDPSHYPAAFGQLDFFSAGEPGLNLGKIIAQISNGRSLHVMHGKHHNAFCPLRSLPRRPNCQAESRTRTLTRCDGECLPSPLANRETAPHPFPLCDGIPPTPLGATPATQGHPASEQGRPTAFPSIEASRKASFGSMAIRPSRGEGIWNFSPARTFCFGIAGDGRRSLTLDSAFSAHSPHFPGCARIPSL